MCLSIRSRHKAMWSKLGRICHLPASNLLLSARIINAHHQARLTRSIWTVYGFPPIRSQSVVFSFPFLFSFFLGGGRSSETFQLESFLAEDKLFHIAITNRALILQTCSLCLASVTFLELQIILKLYKQFLMAPKEKKIGFYYMAIASIILIKQYEFNFAATYQWSNSNRLYICFYFK